ncbi:MAG: flavodoxin family protein [Roseburia sp.]
MGKQVLLIKGSPRKNGNTSVMADAFGNGAKESGNTVTEVFLKEKNIGDCIGCAVCQRNGGNCVQKDDMTEIYESMKAAEVIVLASPVYFYSWTSLMKRMIDRTFAVEALLENKKFYLLSAGAAPEEKYMQTMINGFREYVSCFEEGGSKEGGILFAYDTREPGDVNGMQVLEKAYEMGKTI